MKDKCIFCSKELGMFEKKKLSCGGTTQVLCGDCYDVYSPLNAIERAEAALKTGQAEDEDTLIKYLEPIKEAQNLKNEEMKQKAEKRMTDKECLRCKGKMLDYGPVTFKLGEETYFWSDINRLMSGSLTFNVLVCENCGKAEFFISDRKDIEEISEKN